jgi:hypothetical protein
MGEGWECAGGDVEEEEEEEDDEEVVVVRGKGGRLANAWRT